VIGVERGDLFLDDAITYIIDSSNRERSGLVPVLAKIFAGAARVPPVIEPAATEGGSLS
jgi:hypothetical protein